MARRRRPPGKEFKHSSKGIAALQRSAGPVNDALRRARQGAAYARDIAPKRSGRYASSIRATLAIRARDGRVVGVIYSDDVAAFQIEFGTSDTPAHRTLRRAMLEGTR